MIVKVRQRLQYYWDWDLMVQEVVRQQEQERTRVILLERLGKSINIRDGWGDCKLGQTRQDGRQERSQWNAWDSTAWKGILRERHTIFMSCWKLYCHSRHHEHVVTQRARQDIWILYLLCVCYVHVHLPLELMFKSRHVLFQLTIANASFTWREISLSLSISFSRTISAGEVQGSSI